MTTTKNKTAKTTNKKNVPAASVTEAKMYTKEGKANGMVSLPDTVFGVAWNPNLVHEVVVSMQSNARAGTAHTKDRSEVAGGGKKPWRQKGTGRARHGSNRSPIWTGGGVTFGPRSEKNYIKKINKKMRAKALASTLSKKYADGEIVFLDTMQFDTPKTSAAKLLLKALADGTKQVDLATKRKNAALVVLPARDEIVEKSFRNFGNVDVAQAKDINTVDLLTYKYVIVATPETSIEQLEKRIV